MNPSRPFRAEVLIAGVGGKGVLVAGQLLARAASALYSNVTYLPSYSASQRGGPCECTVVFSEAPVSSPLLPQVDTVIVMDISQLAPFETRVRPGGLLMVEEAGLGSDFTTKQATMQELQSTTISRTDLRVVTIPALDIAMKTFGSQQGSNLVLLGAYVGATQVIDPAHVESDLEERFGDKPELLTKNRQAFSRGLDAGAALKE